MGGSTQEAAWCREITRLSGPVMGPLGGENQEMLQVYHSFPRDSQITIEEMFRGFAGILISSSLQ